jgi:hypothetical protein
MSCVQPNAISNGKAAFYEQVTGGQGLVLRFSFIGFCSCCCSCSSLRRMLLSTLVSMRTLMSCLDASSVPFGVREESRCCHFSGLRVHLCQQSCSGILTDAHSAFRAATVPGRGPRADREGASRSNHRTNVEARSDPSNATRFGQPTVRYSHLQ